MEGPNRYVGRSYSSVQCVLSTVNLKGYNIDLDVRLRCYLIASVVVVYIEYLVCCINQFMIEIPAALVMKGIEYEYKAVHLVQDGGQQVGIVNIWFLVEPKFDSICNYLRCSLLTLTKL